MTLCRTATLLLIGLVWCSFGDTASFGQDTVGKVHSPTLNSDYPDRLLWGDLHLHSNLSMDAYSLGNESLSPDEAYRFAKGETITSTSGGPAKLSRPLDFLSVTDHAEYVGVLAGLTDEKVSAWEIGTKKPSFWSRWFGSEKQTLKEALLETSVARRWNDKMAKGEQQEIVLEFAAAANDPENADLIPPDLQKSIWQIVAETTDKHNIPGQFTTFIGYEWTSMIEGNNLHRVVLYKDDASIAGQVRPASALDGLDPEKLWASLERYEKQTGGDVLAISHNGNVSNGLMFAETKFNGEPIDKAYAQTRMKWEPVYEMTQVKGDGETHPILSPDDEFADFETWDDGNIGMTAGKSDSMLEFEYARSALNVGLRLENKVGINPYKFGMIGSTDSHTGLSTADNNNFFGKFPASEPTIARLSNNMAGSMWPNITITSSGYTAVWAKGNTRAEIFDALERKEVYASTGPRIALRFFGGAALTADDLTASDFIDRAYTKGVPMGGTLPNSEPPTFLVMAMRDPMGANLDRIQIIKGWVDEDGKSHEKVHDVSLSDGREIDDSGQVPAVGNTVNLETATYTNTIGAPQLSARWIDPEFNPAIDAFYYVRVLEIPTPRWSTYDAVRFGVERPDNVPSSIQERAYSSPIWYEAKQ